LACLAGAEVESEWLRKHVLAVSATPPPLEGGGKALFAPIEQEVLDTAAMHVEAAFEQDAAQQLELGSVM
jgi:hypothetical protein